MSAIKKIIENSIAKTTMRKQYENEDKVVTGIQQRKLSHNERVYNQLMEEYRQEKIKEGIKMMEEKRKADERNKEKNFMKFNPELFRESPENSILKQPNIFCGGNRIW